MPVRIVLVDSHPIMRHGLADLISQQTHARVIAEASGCTDACAIISTLQPDLVLFDLSLGDAEGTEILHRFREHFAGLRALVYTDDSRKETVAAALDAEVQGYVLKASPSERLFEALRVIAAGRTYLDPAITEIVLHSAGGRPDRQSRAALTSRQTAILRMIGSGMANKEIARQLEISERTVKFHVSHIFHRLNVRSRLQAARVAGELTKAVHRGLPSSGLADAS